MLAKKGVTAFSVVIRSAETPKSVRAELVVRQGFPDGSIISP
jgi:hypothetical protein